MRDDDAPADFSGDGLGSSTQPPPPPAQPLSAPHATSPPPPMQQYVPPATGAYAPPPSTGYQQRPSSSKTPWILGGAALVVLFLVGLFAVGLFLFRSSEDLRDDFAADPEVTLSDRGTDRLTSSGSTDALPEDRIEIQVSDNNVLEFEDSITANSYDTFLIELEAGSSVQVTVEAAGGSGLDPVLGAVSPSGQQVAANDDALLAGDFLAGLNSQIEFTADSTGTYTFEVVGYDQNESGDYLLIVDRR